MKTITNPEDFHLPTVTDGVDGFLRMADVFGERETLNFLSLAYLNTGSPHAQARQILAARAIADHLHRNPGDKYVTARRKVGNELGFPGPNLSNFNRIADPGRDLLRERGEWPYDDREDQA